MVAPDREFRRYRRLLSPHAHQPALGALAERQAERIEQDGFAGTGLAGQHAETRAEGKVETVDQNDIADGQAEQHCKPRIVALINDIVGAVAKPASVRRQVIKDPRRPPWISRSFIAILPSN